MRFISDDGQEHTGDAILPEGTTDASQSTSARIIQGDILGNFTVTDEVMVSESRLNFAPKVVLILLSEHHHASFPDFS